MAKKPKPGGKKETPKLGFMTAREKPTKKGK